MKTIIFIFLFLLNIFNAYSDDNIENVKSEIYKLKAEYSPKPGMKMTEVEKIYGLGDGANFKPGRLQYFLTVEEEIAARPPQKYIIRYLVDYNGKGEVISSIIDLPNKIDRSALIYNEKFEAKLYSEKDRLEESLFFMRLIKIAIDKKNTSNNTDSPNGKTP